MSDQPTAIRGIDPKEHDCDPPGGQELAHNGAAYARWRCPTCRSRWTWRNPAEGGWFWKRSTGSSRRWRREERARIEQALYGDTNGRGDTDG